MKTEQEIQEAANEYVAGMETSFDATNIKIAQIGFIDGAKFNQTEKTVLDACCGSRMFWFDKKNKDVVFSDIRNESHILCDGRTLDVCPDVLADFKSLPFPDNSFYHVVFDPPHLKSVGDDAYMAKKYGKLTKEWKSDLSKGFSECMRVLKPNGTLVFKWNEDQIKVSEILSCFDAKPLYGHKSGKNSKTHWIVFMKPLNPNS